MASSSKAYKESSIITNYLEKKESNGWKFKVLDAFRSAALAQDEASKAVFESRLIELDAAWAATILVAGALNLVPPEWKDFGKQLKVVWNELMLYIYAKAGQAGSGENENDNAFDFKKLTEACLRVYWPRNLRNHWRGVNLGGWLLLEQGPANPLFETFGEPKDEYSLMTAPHKDKDMQHMRGAHAIPHHRDTHTSLEDFKRIKQFGFNCVRLPFGYWVVTGPTNGDPYVGPAMHYIDAALSWAQETDLYVVLDLHGCPGGQGHEQQCGREKKNWQWDVDWRRDESLQVIRTFCKRYAGHPRVVGVEVTNEPSADIPCDVLCQYYEDGIRAVRESGMSADQVAVLLPVYYEPRLEEIAEAFTEREIWLKHDNIALDIHYYHSFGGYTVKTSHETHLKWVRNHGTVLKNLPGACVGEWSLARPGTFNTAKMAEWANVQEKQYDKGSHGAFFWNWRDFPRLPEWDMQQSIAKGWIRIPDDPEGGRPDLSPRKSPTAAEFTKEIKQSTPKRVAEDPPEGAPVPPKRVVDIRSFFPKSDSAGQNKESTLSALRIGALQNASATRPQVNAASSSAAPKPTVTYKSEKIPIDLDSDDSH